MAATRKETAHGNGHEPERSADGRYLIIEGRKWRSSDPSIPSQLRQELVDELMSARRAVRADQSGARSRVNDAKVALGERGHPWWEPRDPVMLDARIAATMRALLRKRQGSTICPSDVSRIVGGEDWRELMAAVRQLVATLAADGQVVATQRGKTVDATAARGPLRIATGPRFPHSTTPSPGASMDPPAVDERHEREGG